MGARSGNRLLTQLRYKVPTEKEVEVDCPSGSVVMDVSGTTNGASFFYAKGSILNFVSSSSSTIGNTDNATYCKISEGSSEGKIKLHNKANETLTVFLSIQRTSE